MSDQLPPVENHTAGETLEHTITAYEDAAHETIKDLTNGSVEWALLTFDRDEVVLDESASGVTAEISAPADGEVTVRFDRGATTDLDGRYEQRLEVVDGAGDSQIYLGTVRIEDGGP